MEFNFKTKKVAAKVIVDDIAYEVLKPSTEAVLDFQKAQADKKEDYAQIEAMLDFFDCLGLPKSISIKIPIEDLNDFASKLMSLDKKK